MGKRVSYDCFVCGIQDLIVMADSLMLETQQPIIVIISSCFFLKVKIYMYIKYIYSLNNHNAIIGDSRAGH